jgi:hypothetical protein
LVLEKTKMASLVADPAFVFFWANEFTVSANKKAQQ